MSRWVLRVALTEAQVRELSLIAAGAALAPDKYGVVGGAAMYALSQGCTDLKKEIDDRAKKCEAVKQPCPWCGRSLMFGSPGRGGLSLPREHKCPHGERCSPREGTYSGHSRCLKCRIATGKPLPQDDARRIVEAAKRIRDSQTPDGALDSERAEIINDYSLTNEEWEKALDVAEEWARRKAGGAL